MVEALGLTATIELREDGTCTVDIFGDTDECTYTDTAITTGTTTTAYTYADSSLTFKQEGNELTFTRNKE